MVIFFNFSPTSNHLRPLQVENCDSNSRLVGDEDDNGKFRLQRVKLTCHQGCYHHPSPSPRPCLICSSLPCLRYPPPPCWSLKLGNQCRPWRPVRHLLRSVCFSSYSLGGVDEAVYLWGRLSLPCCCSLLRGHWTSRSWVRSARLSARLAPDLRR